MSGISRADFMKLSDEERMQLVVNNISSQGIPDKSNNYGLSEYEIQFNRHQEIMTELKNIVSAIKDLTKMYEEVNNSR